MKWMTQTDRFLEVKTPSQSELILIDFSGTESVSAPFEYRLRMVSNDTDIKPVYLIGNSVTVKLNISRRQPPRYFNGIVHQFEAGPIVQGTRHYYATLRPWLSLLNYASDCRIFQQQSVPDILDQLFEQAPGACPCDWSGVSRGRYPRRDYCVQYRETTLHFVSRLLEEEGIFYYFRHEQNQHTLVLGDSPAAIKPSTDAQAVFTKKSDKDQSITDFSRHYRFYTGKASHRDYNPATPSLTLENQQPTSGGLRVANQYEQYDYPGLYSDSEYGQSLAQVRQQSLAAQYETLQGSGNYAGFSAGTKFTLSGAPNPGDDGSYALLSVMHTASDESYLHDANGEGSQSYTNHFVCIPAQTPYKPALTHHKPRVYGAQTAVVTGTAGQELDTRQYGQAFVQFHWDRQGQKNNNSSCRLRVAQLLAGSNWGAVFMPRIGQEVLVHFLEGDPDRPVIMGALYNENNLPPYSMPDEQNKSGIRTQSTKGAGPNDYNELRFDDSKSKEEIFIQAQKDFNQTIKNNLSVTVGNDHSHQTAHDSKVTVGNDYSHQTARNATLTVGHDLAESIQHNANFTIGNDYRETVTQDVVTQIGRNATQTIKNNWTLDIGKIGRMTAMETLVIQVGTTTVTISPSGVDIKASKFSVHKS